MTLKSVHELQKQGQWSGSPAASILVLHLARNCFDLDRVRKSMYLGIVLQREQELLGWSRPPAKRRIDVVLQEDSSNTPNVEEFDQDAFPFPIEDPENVNLEASAQHLIDDAMANIDDEPDAIFVDKVLY